MYFKKVLSAVVVLSACTTTHVEQGGLQDGTFTAASYDRELDERDATLRSVDELSAGSPVHHVLRKDYYLPAQQLKDIGRKADAAKKKLRTQASADPEALRVLAVEAIAEGRHEQVEGFIRHAKSMRGKRQLQGTDHLLMGIAASMSGQMDAAKRMLLTASQSPEVTASAKANLGIIAGKYGAFSEALEMFRQAETLEPENLRILHLVAEAAHAARQHALSVETYKKIIRSDKNDLLARYNLALVYHYGMRKYEDSIEGFQYVMSHPRVTRELRILAEGGLANVRREEEGFEGLATTGFQ